MKERADQIKELAKAHRFSEAFRLIAGWNTQGLLSASEYVALIRSL